MRTVTSAVALVALIFISGVFAQEKFEVVPDTVGIGLQKNFDVVDFYSSDEKRCVRYDLGNPWSTNVTGWIEVGGDLEKYFVGNEPEEVFVPSGTFRYNASCCLLPIYACFKFPYVLNDTYFTGRVSSAFRVGESRRVGGTGSATGSSVAYTLTVHIMPLTELVFRAGETKCLDIYGVGKRCFSAPWVVLSDTTEKVNIEGHEVMFIYKNNLAVILLVVALVAAFYFWFRSKRKKDL